MFIKGSVFAAVLMGGLSFSSAASPRTKEAMEPATRLQVFLDRSNFSPGKLDGRFGEFTVKALNLYRQSKGEQPKPAAPAKKDATPDVTGLDFSTATPVFITYTVTDADLATVGELGATVELKAKQKSLPYKDAAEAIAEKFHSDVDFLEELNPGKMKAIKAGDHLNVPNVEPFDLAAVKNLTPGSSTAVNDEEDTTEPNGAPPADKPDTVTLSVSVDVKSGMLQVQEGAHIIAAYPVTVGSAHTESPIGEWKVKGVAKMPNFRYDKEMLNHGKRSGDFQLLPPGPNNPVGVMWIQLNKKGIGLHGTDDPDSIGRSASHGCVRLANWDVARLATRVKGGVPVSIH